MLIKLFIIVILLLIVGSLFSALFFLIKDKGQGSRAARALTFRIALSIGLFLLLMLGYYAGVVGPPHP